MSTVPTPIGVLVVDDHAMVAEGLTLAARSRSELAVRGVAPTIAAALELAAEAQPDVIVLDAKLPDGDGIAAVGGLKAAAPGAKVLVVSGFVSDHAIFRAIDAGVDGLMTKGRSLDDILDSVVRVAHGESVFSPEMLAKLLGRAGGPGAARDRSTLTTRELDVLEQLASGASTEAIGAAMHLSPNTVRNHIARILLKLGASTRLEAVAIGIRSRLVNPPIG